MMIIEQSPVEKPEGAKWKIEAGIRLFAMPNGIIQARKRAPKNGRQIGVIAGVQGSQFSILHL